MNRKLSARGFSGKQNPVVWIEKADMLLDLWAIQVLDICQLCIGWWKKKTQTGKYSTLKSNATV